MPAVNDHVIRRERDETGTTVAQALDDVAKLCDNAAEAAPLFRQVLGRLEAARDEFEATYPKIDESDKKRLLRMFEDEIVKFTGEVRYYCATSVTGRVLQHKKLSKRMKEIHEGARNVSNYFEGGLDELFRQLRNNRTIETNWQEPLAEAVQAFEARVLAMVEDDAVLKPFQDDPLVALEAATLLCKAEKKRDRLEWFDNKPAQKLRDKIKKIADSDDIKLPEWFLPESDINYRSRRFAQGAFGAAHYGTWGSGTNVVVKVLLTGNDTNQRLSNMLRKKFIEEADLWSKMSHPYVLKLYGACHVTSPPFFVCEDATNGNLSTLLQKDKSRIWRLLFQTALAIEYLHGKDIVHGDLKLDNVLVGADGYARVADFGLSRLRKPTPNRVLSRHDSVLDSSGALRWRAPEALDYKAIAESDIYSFGMCIIEALSDEIPYPNLSDDEVREHISNHKLPERPAAMSDEIWALVQKMTAFEPKDRATIEDVSTVLKKLANEQVNEEIESTSLCQICSTKVDKKTSYCEKCQRVQITKPMSKEVGKIQSKEDLPRVIEYLTLSDGQHEHKAPNALREYMFGMPDHQVEVYDAGAIPVLAKILADKRKPNITMHIFTHSKIEAVTALGCTAVANKKNQDAAKFEKVMDSLKRELLSELSSDDQDNVELVKAMDLMRTKAVLVLAYMAHANAEIRGDITSDSDIMNKIRDLERSSANEELQMAATRALMFLDPQEAATGA